MGRKNRPRIRERAEEPPVSKYARKLKAFVATSTQNTCENRPKGTLATVIAVPRGAGVVFARTNNGIELSINMSVVRRDYKSGTPRVGWSIDCDYETNPEWKRPRVKRIHSVTPD